MTKRKTNSKNTDNSTKILYLLVGFFTVILIAAIISAVMIATSDKGGEEVPPAVEQQLEMPEITKNPVATILMEDGGEFVAELYPEIAPNTVCNFISLANSGFYDGVIFHRCIKDFMIQGGDPDGIGTGGPGYSIKGEFSANGFANDLKHTRGVLSMARSPHMDSAGSQFFIMVADTPSLDGQYAAFGKVTSGIEIADKIVELPQDSSNKPLEDVVIKSIRVDTFGVEYPQPIKLEER